MILARQTCFCGALRWLTIASSRRRSSGMTLTTIPAPMTRAWTASGNLGVARTNETTSSALPAQPKRQGKRHKRATTVRLKVPMRRAGADRRSGDEAGVMLVERREAGHFIVGAGHHLQGRSPILRRKAAALQRWHEPDDARVSSPVVCPAKAGMFSRRQTCRGKSQAPRSLARRAAGNQDSEAYRQGLPWGDYESPGRNESERGSGLESE
jgi:hypothetical protein